MLSASLNKRFPSLLQSDWTFNIGEQAIDISVITYPQAPPSILVLGKQQNNSVEPSGVNTVLMYSWSGIDPVNVPVNESVEYR